MNKLILLIICLTSFIHASQIHTVDIFRLESDDQLFEKSFFYNIFSKYSSLDHFFKANNHKTKFISRHLSKIKNYYSSYQRRLNKLRLKYDDNIAVEAVSNYWEVEFYGEVSIGTPPQKLLLQFDTGSSDLWIPLPGCNGCNNTFTFKENLSTTLNLTNIPFEIVYNNGSSYTTGFVAYDTVHIAGLETSNFQLAVVNQAVGNLPNPASGVLGLSYQGLSAANPPAKNLVDVLYGEGKIEQQLFSLYLSPHQNEYGSKLFFGGVDSNYFTGEINYHQILTIQSAYYINYKGFEVNGVSIADPNGSTLVDSGTALIHAPQNVIDSLLGQIGNINGDCEGIDNPNYPVIYIVIDEVKYPLTPEQYIFNSHTHQKCVFAITNAFNIGSILGDLFQRVYYGVFDLKNNQLGFAKAI